MIAGYLGGMKRRAVRRISAQKISPSANGDELSRYCRPNQIKPKHDGTDDRLHPIVKESKKLLFVSRSITFTFHEQYVLKEDERGVRSTTLFNTLGLKCHRGARSR
jgi:hypothetical protein